MYLLIDYFCKLICIEMPLKTSHCNSCLFKTICDQTIGKEDFDDLYRSTTFQIFRKGEIILRQHMKMSNLVFLHTGIVKFCYNNYGKDIILTIDKAPTLLGLANYLNNNVNFFSIIAIEDCEGCMIDEDVFQRILTNNPSFALQALNSFTNMFRQSMQSFISLSYNQVQGRIANILVFLSKHIYESSLFHLPLTRKEIAQFAGCSTENVINTLRKFDHDGIIRINGKEIEILDEKGLQLVCRMG